MSEIRGFGSPQPTRSSSGDVARTAPRGQEMEFIDFGCGTGRSMSFASSLLGGTGIGIDISPRAVETCRAKGFEASVSDIVSFTENNVASSAFAIDVLPELDRQNFEQSCINLIRSARNFIFIQHQYFDMDASLALQGQYISANFGKSIRYKPTLADYLMLLRRHGRGLNIVGLAVFGLGRAGLSPILGESLVGQEESEASDEVFRTMRIVVGRKDIRRFRLALEKAGTTKKIFVWEAP